MQPFVRHLSILALALVLVRCGGGGGGAGTPGTQPGAPGTPQMAQTAFTIVVPRASGTASVHPSVIPSDTQSISIVITAINGSAPPSGVQTTFNATLTTSNPNCAQGTSGLACTIAITSPTGNVTYTVSLFSTTNETGSPVAQGTTTATITVGTNNVVNLTLALVGGALALALQNTAPQSGSSTTIGVTLSELDGGGTPITGTYPNPIVLTDSDTSGATSLAVNGKAGTTVTTSADVVTLAYTGLAIAPVTIGASTTGLASASATLTPGIAAVVLAPTSLSFQGTASLGGVGASTVTATQAGWTGSFGHTIAVTNGSPSCNLGNASTQIVSLPSTNGTSFAITPQNAGSCSLLFSGGAGASSSLPISVTTTKVIIQSHGSPR